MAGLAPIFTTIMPAISAASTVFGAISRSNSQSRVGLDQQQAMNYNAAIAQQNAAAARSAAAADAQTQMRINAARYGRLSTQILKQGVELEGTPLLLLDEEIAQGALEAEKIKAKGENAARNYQNQANNFTYQGEQAVRSSETQAGTTLLTGLVDAGGTYVNQQMRIDQNYRPYRG
jgi:hypothetical protein